MKSARGDDDDAWLADYVDAFVAEQTPSADEVARVWAGVKHHTRARRAQRWTLLGLAVAAVVAGFWVAKPVFDRFDRQDLGPTHQAPYDARSKAAVEGVLRHDAAPNGPHLAAPEDMQEEAIAPRDEPEPLPPHRPRSRSRRTNTRDALPSPPPAPKVESSPPRGPTAVAQETKLYRRIQQSLRRGRPAETLALCREHERQFPSGLFAAEREVVTALSLCDLGRRAEALAHAETFVSAHPKSHLNATMRTICPAHPTVTDSGTSTHELSRHDEHEPR